MSHNTITSQEKELLYGPIDKKKDNISILKATLILFFTVIIFALIAILIGYKFFWYQPAYSSVEDYRLQTAVNNVKQFPGNASLRVELGWNYMQMGEFEAAKREFEKALKLDEGNLGANVNIAMVFAEQGDLKKSKELLTKTIKANPGAPDAHLALGQLYLQTKEYESAIHEFNFLLDLNPGTVDFVYMIGKAYEGMGDIENAKKQYEEAINYVPDFEKAKVALENLKKRKEAGK